MEQSSTSSGSVLSVEEEEQQQLLPKPVAPRQHFRLQTEAYTLQTERWPTFGQFILAQYTDEAILVYQAFKPEIGRYAVANQRFAGCPLYNTTRMTWIKTNFLWMMFRSGWGQKNNQEMTLGIWLKRSAFDRYLSIATKREVAERRRSIVRLQWDPDHDPSGTPVKRRRAIQLGLKNVESFASGEDILAIHDMTDFVANCTPGDPNTLVTPKEEIYEPGDASIGAQIGLSRESNEGSIGEKPLRVTLCHKGRRKTAVLQPRTMLQLSALVQQKLRVKPNLVTDNNGKTILDPELAAVPQDAVLHIS
ncbi:DUF4291 domain-containing protein [Balamuthia mandrillaris]